MTNREQYICTTSEETPQKFHSKYCRVALPVAKQGSERIFICNLQGIEKEFLEASNGLNEEQEHRPASSSANGIKCAFGMGKLFPKHVQIPLLLWILEFHLTYGWKAYVADALSVSSFNNESGNPVTYLDFVIAREEEHDLIISIAEQSNPIVFLGERIDSYMADVSLDAGCENQRRTFKFFSSIKNNLARPIDAFLTDISGQEDIMEFTWDTMSHKNATLKDIVELCNVYRSVEGQN